MLCPKNFMLKEPLTVVSSISILQKTEIPVQKDMITYINQTRDDSIKLDSYDKITKKICLGKPNIRTSSLFHHLQLHLNIVSCLS